MSTTTSDGIVMDGAFFAPEPGTSRKGPVDAILLIHGSGSRFYAPYSLEMAEDLRAQGYACLALNTRGHDTVWVNREDGTHHGNAFEILDLSRLDLRAGIDYLCGLGYGSIGILGHSMGAVKVAYYAAIEQDDRVTTVIPVSPVRLSYSYYMESEDAEEFQSIIQQADDMKAEDRAQELITVNFPIPETFTASAYIDKHGPAERYNLVRLAPRIKIPMFILAGSLETHTRLRDIAPDLALAAVNSPRSEYLIVDGGRHALGNRRNEASDAVLKWLASLATKKVMV